MEYIGPSLEQNMHWLKKAMGETVDLRLVKVRTAGGVPVLVAGLTGLMDAHLVQEGVIEPLQRHAVGFGSLPDLALQVLQVPGWTFVQKQQQVLGKLVRGQAIVFVDGQEGALALDTRGGEQRAPEEPENEPAVRGARDGLVENLGTNRALIRRRLNTPALRFERIVIGKVSKTRVEMAYLDGVTATDLLDEVRRRLKAVETDGILDTGVLEEFIEDNHLSPFPQIDHTGRPDKVVAALWAGRVAILVDQSPTALLVPTVFWHFLQAPEDYYERWWTGSALRLLRSVGVIISLTLPGLWVMLVAFHQELLPTPLALSIAAGREHVPIPALLEALSMEFTFELLREAGARLPRAIGQTVSIVGALVIGQAAVQAGLVSPSAVIVVAMTGLSSFVTPSFSVAYSFRILRFMVLLLSGVLGILGFAFSTLLILMHLLALKSFGTSYMSPVVPYMPGAARETLLRPGWHWLKRQNRRWWLT